MDEDTRYVFGGAAIGAMLGALAVWLYTRYGMRDRRGDQPGPKVPGKVDSGRIMRLGWSVIGVVRQILDLNV